jgi:hypothetical protein
MNNSRIINILVVILGIFFAITGIAKVFVVSTFAGTIHSFTFLSLYTAYVLAVGIIVSEIFFGTLLILRYRVAIASFALCFLMAIFMWVLAVAVLRGQEIVCHCFGILNINLPNCVELTIDMILFNVLAIIGYVHVKKKPHAEETGFKKRLPAVLMLVVVLYLEAGLVYPAYRREPGNITVNLPPLYPLIRRENPMFLQKSMEGNWLIFTMRFFDFNCSLCFDDFITLSDSIDRRLTDSQRQRVIAIFCQDDIADPANPDRLKRWANRNGILYPIVIAPDSLFEKTGLQKSAVIVLDERGNSLLSREIPLGATAHRQILQYIRQTR